MASQASAVRVKFVERTPDEMRSGAGLAARFDPGRVRSSLVRAGGAKLILGRERVRKPALMTRIFRPQVYKDGAKWAAADRKLARNDIIVRHLAEPGVSLDKLNKLLKNASGPLEIAEPGPMDARAIEQYDTIGKNIKRYNAAHPRSAISLPKPKDVPYRSETTKNAARLELEAMRWGVDLARTLRYGQAQYARVRNFNTDLQSVMDKLGAHQGVGKLPASIAAAVEPLLGGRDWSALDGYERSAILKGLFEGVLRGAEKHQGTDLHTVIYTDAATSADRLKIFTAAHQRRLGRQIIADEDQSAKAHRQMHKQAQKFGNKLIKEGGGTVKPASGGNAPVPPAPPVPPQAPPAPQIRAANSPAGSAMRQQGQQDGIASCATWIQNNPLIPTGSDFAVEVQNTIQLLQLPDAQLLALAQKNTPDVFLKINVPANSQKEQAALYREYIKGCLQGIESFQNKLPDAATRTPAEANVHDVLYRCASEMRTAVESGGPDIVLQPGEAGRAGGIFSGWSKTAQNVTWDLAAFDTVLRDPSKSADAAWMLNLCGDTMADWSRNPVDVLGRLLKLAAQAGPASVIPVLHQVRNEAIRAEKADRSSAANPFTATPGTLIDRMKDELAEIVARNIDPAKCTSQAFKLLLAHISVSQGDPMLYDGLLQFATREGAAAHVIARLQHLVATHPAPATAANPFAAPTLNPFAPSTPVAVAPPVVPAPGSPSPGATVGTAANPFAGTSFFANVSQAGAGGAASAPPKLPPWIVSASFGPRHGVQAPNWTADFMKAAKATANMNGRDYFDAIYKAWQADSEWRDNPMPLQALMGLIASQRDSIANNAGLAFLKKEFPRQFDECAAQGFLDSECEKLIESWFEGGLAAIKKVASTLTLNANRTAAEEALLQSIYVNNLHL
jgi:hypothetical protein